MRFCFLKMIAMNSFMLVTEWFWYPLSHSLHVKQMPHSPYTGPQLFNNCRARLTKPLGPRGSSQAEGFISSCWPSP